MINDSLKTGNKRTLSINPKKADGSVATLDGVPTWVNNGAGTLEVAEDGMSAVVRQLPLKAIADVTVTADADLDEDEVRTLTENFVILGRSNDLNEASDLGASTGTEEVDPNA
jgi:hypothetical protein